MNPSRIFFFRAPRIRDLSAHANSLGLKLEVRPAPVNIRQHRHWRYENTQSFKQLLGLDQPPLQLFPYSLHYSATSIIMASESCASIIDWLSDVEASDQWEEHSLQDPSLPCATSSPPIHSTSSLLSSPCFITSQQSRKRKHQTNKLECYSKGSYFPRKPLEETMSSPNKRPRTDDETPEDAQMAGAEVSFVNHDTALRSFLTIVNSNTLLKHPKRELLQCHHPSYEHPLPRALSPKRQAVRRRKLLA